MLFSRTFAVIHRYVACTRITYQTSYQKFFLNILSTCYKHQPYIHCIYL